MARRGLLSTTVWNLMQRSFRRRRIAVGWIVSAVLLGLLWYQNAWVADDAFITFRSVEQFAHGHGPRWNPQERVQAFTHPLWFFGLALTRLFSANLYWNCVLLGLAVSAVFVLLVRRYFGSDVLGWVLALALLLSSKGWFDYLWSGLENPLYYMFLVLLLLELKRQGEADAALATEATASLWRGSVFRVSLLLAFLFLCRPDLVLLVLPVWLYVLAEGRHRSWQVLFRETVVGFLPAIAWELFSCIYYGFPLPNTAYAKLSHGLSTAWQRRHGVDYLLNCLTVTVRPTTGGERSSPTAGGQSICCAVLASMRCARGQLIAARSSRPPA